MTTEPVDRLNPRSGPKDPAPVLANVANALSDLKFGQIIITVHDGAVVQIERIERTRMQRRTD